MFSKSHRFHGYNALRGVYARGQNVRGELLSLKFVRREAHKPYRVGVVVSRKVHKSAVVRNRIRRRVYEQVRAHEADIKPGTDLVFTVYSDKVATLDSSKLAAAVNSLISKT
jgi:ribonuclease P protein component